MPITSDGPYLKPTETVVDFLQQVSVILDGPYLKPTETVIDFLQQVPVGMVQQSPDGSVGTAPHGVRQGGVTVEVEHLYPGCGVTNQPISELLLPANARVHKSSPTV